MANRCSSQVVITDVPTSGGAEYAISQGIDVLAFPVKGESGQGSTAITVHSAEELASTLSDDYKIDFVLLAGYLKLVPPAVVQAFTRRMLNIHPGLLPAFGGKGMYGMNVHKAVISSGSRYCSLPDVIKRWARVESHANKDLYIICNKNETRYWYVTGTAAPLYIL